MTPADVVAAITAGRTPEEVIADLGQPPPPPWSREQLDQLAAILRPDPAQPLHHRPARRSA
jgi:hypothetical protein